MQGKTEWMFWLAVVAILASAYALATAPDIVARSL